MEILIGKIYFYEGMTRSFYSMIKTKEKKHNHVRLCQYKVTTNLAHSSVPSQNFNNNTFNLKGVDLMTIVRGLYSLKKSTILVIV